MWHGTCENKTSGTRWSLIATFSSWWLKQSMDMVRSLPRYIYNKLSINENEIVYTSGDGGYFNSGIPIGITMIKNDKMHVIPSNNFEELQYMQIFVNNFKGF